MKWARHRLKHLASVRVSNVDKKTVDGQTPVRLINYTDVYYGDRLSPDMALMSASATQQQISDFRLFPGDVVITKDSETADDIGVAAYVDRSADDMVCGYHLGVLRPRRGVVDGRYLYWSVVSDHARSQFSAGATGVTRFGLRIDVIASTEVLVPSLIEQRAIADFLDAENTRVEELMAKRHRLIELVDERLSGQVELEIRALADAFGEIPLKFTVPEVTVGIVVTPAKWYSTRGVPAVRGTNIEPGRIDTNDLVHLSQAGHELHRKSELRKGDLLVVRTGQAGAAAVVPAEFDGANCIDVLLVRRSEVILPRYLEYVINSDWTRKHIQAHSVGTIQSHFNVGSLRELRIPVPTIDAQRAVVQRLDAESSRVRALVSSLGRQVSLLAEHRQALITAAVTGELDVARHLAKAPS